MKKEREWKSSTKERKIEKSEAMWYLTIKFFVNNVSHTQ